MDVEQLLASEPLPRYGLFPLGELWPEFADAGQELKYPAFEAHGLSDWMTRVQESLVDLHRSGRWVELSGPGLTGLHPCVVAGALRYRFSKSDPAGGYSIPPQGRLGGVDLSDPTKGSQREAPRARHGVG